MASSKIMIALLFAFAVMSATLPPSTAARAPPGLKAAAENHKADDGGLLHPTSASGGSPATTGLPGLPGLQFPPLPGLGGGALFPPLPGLAGLIAGLLFPPQAGSTAPTAPQPTECMTPLTSMMPCTDYLTNLTVLTPPSACCDGLRSVIRDASICLCHGMNGGLNSLLPRPVDPVRMLILPLACGTVPPLQTLFMCASPQVPPIMPPVAAGPPTVPSASP